MVDRTEDQDFQDYGAGEKQPLSRKKKILLALVAVVVILIIVLGYRLYKNWALKDATPATETTAVMKEKDDAKEVTKVTVKTEEKTTVTKTTETYEEDDVRIEETRKPVVKIAFVLPLSGKTPEYAKYVKRQILSKDTPTDTKYEYQIIVEDGGKDSSSAVDKASDMIAEYSVDAVVVLRPDARDVVKVTSNKGIIPVSISYVMDSYMTTAEERVIRDPVTLLVDVFEKLPAKDGRKPEKTEIAKALKSYKNALQAGLPAQE